MPTKLSEAWDLAAKELSQCYGIYGSREDKLVCAEGAAAYYLGTAKPVSHPNSLVPNSKVEAMLDEFVKRLRKSGTQYFTDTTISLNDEKRWTFQQFADKARDLGL